MRGGPVATTMLVLVLALGMLPLVACERSRSGAGNASRAPRDARTTSGDVPAAADGSVPAHVLQAVLDVNAHVLVMDSAGGSLAETDPALAKARTIDPAVVAVAPFQFAEVVLGTSGNAHLLKGVAPGSTVLQAELARYVVDGTLALDSRPGEMPIVVGAELAREQQLEVGESVDIALAPSDPSGRPTQRRSARVTGIARTGFDEYDRHLLLTSLRAAQDLVGHDGKVLGIEIKLSRHTDAQRVARALSAALGASYKVIDWCELNRALLGC